MTPIEWFVARREEQIVELEPEWRALAESLAEPSLFAAPEWHRAWWQHYGQGRVPHLVGARQDGVLAALAPLCTRTTVGGIRIRQWIGSEEADWGGLLLAPGAEGLAHDLLRLALRDADWDLVDLWCVPAPSATSQAWRAVMGKGGVRHAEHPLCRNPILDLRTDEWLQGVRREQLGRKRRALGRQGDLRLVFPKETGAVEAALTDLQTLHAARWREAKEISRLTLPGYWAWVRGIAEEAQRRGWLFVPRLELDGRLVATGLFLLYRRQLFQWINGHALEFQRHSPFLLLQHAVIEHVRTGDMADVLDFGRGDEWYKSRWTDRAIQLERLLAWRGLRGRAAHLWQGRLRPWAWTHQDWSRPVRHVKRSIRRILPGGA